ncbi:MAG: YggS family pyridoxal phosphate-dependent enzyme [Pseudomonadota bacterium]
MTVPISETENSTQTSLNHDAGDRLRSIRESLAAALTEAGRAEDTVEIVAISKKHTVETVEPALRAGHRVFGENRVQEAKEKWPTLRDAYPDISLHLVGPLQSNKVKDAVDVFDLIETVDREKIARALKTEMDRVGRHLPCLVQVNIGQEEQKSGIDPTSADEFIRYCSQDLSLDVAGVMCIPPNDEPPAPYFALLKKIADRNALRTVSMGMSGDYEIAAQLGATHVRVGSAIFGPRPT